MIKDLPQREENQYFNSNVLHFANTEKKKKKKGQGHKVKNFEVSLLLFLTPK